MKLQIRLTLPLIIIFLISLNNICLSQKKNPSLQIVVGLAFPSGELGGNFVSTNDSGISFIDTNFIRNNYGTSTGVSITGSLKFPLDQRGILSGMLMGSYGYFNAFKQSVIGTTIQNNITVPVTFDKRFSTTTFGFGIEISPLSGSKISPYINTNLTLNILSLSVTRDNFSPALFSDAFRVGLLSNAGIQINLNQEYSVIVSGSYHLANMLLKSHSEGLNERLEFNRSSLPINDEEGTFYTNLSNPNFFPSSVSGSTKNINWWSLNIGLNIMLGDSPKK